MDYRTDKVASVIREVVGDAIANRLSDPRISRFASITRVEVSGDMQHARVYVSVMGTPAEARTTLAGLDNAVGHVQKILGKRLRMRHCPRIGFVYDDSIKKGDQTLRMIDEAMQTTSSSPTTDGFEDEAESPAPETAP